MKKKEKASAGRRVVLYDSTLREGDQSAHINFSNNTSEVPAGYVNDTGLAYGSRGNGLTFGWSADNTGNARDRNASNSPDELHDSLIHMQTPSNTSQTFTWSIAVPNGTYTVHVVVGDPAYADIVSKLTVMSSSSSASISVDWLITDSAISCPARQLPSEPRFWRKPRRPAPWLFASFCRSILSAMLKQFLACGSFWTMPSRTSSG